ncbi:MAG: tyrosine decarboxylase MfnA [Asgard group archaeon]|nr:tyrosine decarboxylase MfnA [Asgard group archaeon]
MTDTPTDKELLQDLLDKLSNDKNYSQVFSSMCTPPTPLSRDIASTFAEINLGDPGLFPSTVKMEKEVLEDLADLLHAPSGWFGTITSGGSESNLIGCWIGRNWGRKTKGIKNGNIVFPKSAHVSFEKAADLLGLEPRWVDLTENQQVNTDSVHEAMDEQTVSIVGIAGTTGTGVCDDIKALSDLAVDNNVFLHVDAAHGGTILPFLGELGYKQPTFDFQLEGVNSITIDTHKILGSLIPGGSIIVRSLDMASVISKNISYLSDSKTKQITVTGTRPGNAVIASWVLLKKQGKPYLLKRIKESLQNTKYFVEQLKTIPEITLAFEPTINIIGFTNSVFSNEQFVAKLHERGWHLSIYNNWTRVVVMPHVTREAIDKFINDVKLILS